MRWRATLVPREKLGQAPCRSFSRRAYHLCIAATKARKPRGYEKYGKATWIGPSRQSLRHPVGALRAPAVAAVVGDVPAVGDQHEFHRPRRLAREAFGVLPGNDPILLSGNDE